MKILNLPDELQTQVYLPETIDECRKISCTDCICLSHRQEGCPCQFNVYLSQHPVEKPTDIDKLSNVLQDQRSAQDILNMCATLQANTMQMQVGPLQDMVNVLDLIIEVTEKQDKLTATRHECKKEDQIYTENEHVKNEGHADLSICSKMENAADDEFGWDFYHRCPQSQLSFVRLVYNEDRIEHTCPICKRVFLQHTDIPRKSPTLK